MIKFIIKSTKRKIMKSKLIWIALFLGIVACSTSKEQGFVINGNVDSEITGTVFLQDRVAGLMVDVDSATIENGRFVLQGHLDFPEMFYIRIPGVAGRLALFLENQTMEFTLQSTDPVRYTLSGSTSHDIYTGLNDLISNHDSNIRQAQVLLAEAERAGDTDLANRLRHRVEVYQTEKREIVKDYIMEYRHQPAAVFIATRQLVHGSSPEELREIFSIFDTSLNGSRYYDDMKANLLTLEKVAVGMPAIDFRLPNTEGKEVSLSDFRGQYVLISFWASWCPFCREENPALVRVYNQYGGDDFTILGVSLDRTKEAWLRGIEEDGLKWEQVSDLQGWQSGPAANYAIRSIPQNVLIDKEGFIVGRNIKYDELGEKLGVLLQPV